MAAPKQTMPSASAIGSHDKHGSPSIAAPPEEPQYHAAADPNLHNVTSFDNSHLISLRALLSQREAAVAGWSSEVELATEYNKPPPPPPHPDSKPILPKYRAMLAFFKDQKMPDPDLQRMVDNYNRDNPSPGSASQQYEASAAAPNIPSAVDATGKLLTWCYSFIWLLCLKHHPRRMFSICVRP